MGSWFANIHVRKIAGITEDRIVDYICKVMSSRGFEGSREEKNAECSFAMITDKTSDWFTLYSDSFYFEREEGLGAFGMPMSEALCTDVLGIACFDSDFLLLNLLNGAEGLDAHAYVGFFEEEELLPQGDISLWEHKVKDFPRFRDSMEGDYVFAEEVLYEIAPCLNLPAEFSNCGFDYLDELEDDSKITYLYFC